MFLNNNIMTNQEIKNFIGEVTEMREIFDNEIMTYEQLFMILQMFESKIETTKDKPFYCDVSFYSGTKCDNVCQECKGVKKSTEIVELFVKEKLPFSRSIKNKGRFMTNLVTFHEWLRENRLL